MVVSGKLFIEDLQKSCKAALAGDKTKKFSNLRQTSPPQNQLSHRDASESIVLLEVSLAAWWDPPPQKKKRGKKGGQNPKRFGNMIFLVHILNNNLSTSISDVLFEKLPWWITSKTLWAEACCSPKLDASPLHYSHTLPPQRRKTQPVFKMSYRNRHGQTLALISS